MVRAHGREAVIPAHRGRHETQEVGADVLKPPRVLGLARLVVNWLVGALVDLTDVVRGQRVGEIDSRLGGVPRGLYGALVRMSETLVSDICPPPLPLKLPASPV